MLKSALATSSAEGVVMTEAVPSMQVLVVEDDPDVSDGLAIIFKLLGHRCHTAASATDGLAAASAHSPDIAFIDLGLPDMSGVELALRLRAHRSDGRLYMVAMTGFSPLAESPRSLAAFDEYLVKPVEPETLAKTLARAMERRRFAAR
jgi:DNA-binding response OmpR family regulator